MTYSDFSKAIIALTCLREMRGQGMNAMLAVAFVLRNRAAAGWHRGDAYLNAVAADQFSSMTIKGDPNTVWYPEEPNDPEFVQLLQMMDEVFDEANPRVDTVTNGAKYYWVPQNSTSSWFKDNIAGNPTEHPQCAVIGQTVFFK